MNIKKYNYFPALRIRINEVKGLENLDTARKNKIIPLLSLGRWSPKGKDFHRAGEIANRAMGGGPHFLDITDNPRHLPDQQKRLRSSKDGFGNWRAFLNDFPNALPIAQIPDNLDRRNFIQQVLKLEDEKELVGFRIKDTLQEVDLVINALSAMSNPENSIVYIDSKYVRNQVSLYASASIDAALAIRRQIENTNIVALSTSFPRSIVPFADTTEKRGSIDIQEADLFRELPRKCQYCMGITAQFTLWYMTITSVAAGLLE
ncbi:hypothetical protein CDEF62S_05606 [Castellaniella defragrans]